ncbi:MAG: SAM-dependent methyltransferase [Alphaproteobacteria bacterium]|nr:SAM-dependent methyltransferase [Alphaproteobacteria bacterium]
MAERLAARIRASGPITVADFMAAALQDADAGYYRHADPLGRSGDFTTAPEISQMFGELIGLWAADGWSADGAPAPVALVEIGPGRGTMMVDALRAAAVVPAFRDAVRLHLVETSPALRARQRATLAAHRPCWHERFDQVPGGPLILLANELLDALPVHQIVRTRDGWRERGIGLDAAGALAFADTLPAPPSLVPVDDGPPGTVVERRPAADALAAAVARRIIADGGRALLIDYGYAAGRGDTLQAVRGHARVPPLDGPGTADLSAHVDFAALAAAVTAAGARAWGPVPQGAFLRALGIAQRAERLAAARPDARPAIATALHRLIAAGGMGTLFKAFAVTRPDAPAPAGFGEPPAHEEPDP